MDQFQESGRRGFCLFAFDTMNSDQTRPPARLCFDYLEVDLKTPDFGRGIHRFFYQREWRRGIGRREQPELSLFGHMPTAGDLETAHGAQGAESIGGNLFVSMATGRAGRDAKSNQSRK